MGKSEWRKHGPLFNIIKIPCLVGVNKKHFIVVVLKSWSIVLREYYTSYPSQYFYHRFCTPLSEVPDTSTPYINLYLLVRVSPLGVGPRRKSRDSPCTQRVDLYSRTTGTKIVRRGGHLFLWVSCFKLWTYVFFFLRLINFVEKRWKRKEIITTPNQ